MAIYAADIQINVKNKGDLKRLENRFEKLTKSSVSLEKTLKKLGKRNVIQVDTKAALNAINQLETKIKGLSRTVSVDARTSGGGRESGGGGAAVPMMVAAMGGSRGSSRRNTAAFNAKNDLLGISNKASQDLLDRLMIKEKEYTSLVENSSGIVNRSRKEQTNALKDLNKHEEIRVPLYEKLNTAVKNQAALNSKNTKGSGGLIDQLKNLSTLRTALIATANESGFRHRKKHLIDTVKLRNDELKAAKKTHQTNLDDLEVLRKRLEVAKDPSKAMEALSLSERDIDLTKQLNTALATAADKAGTLVSAQSKFTKETAKGGTATKETVDGLKQAEEAARRAAAEVNRIHQALAKPPATGLIGGMKSLGLGGAGKAFGKGALGASAMIPGLTPFTIGAAAGGVGKTGGAALAGGAMGIAGAGAVMGGLALTNFIRQSTIASSEMRKMELALTAVVSSNEDYKKALDSVNEISNSLLIPQAKVTKSFTRLQAAASASGFEVDDVKNMMQGFSAALVSTEGDTKNFNGVMLALGQVMGKGKAAAEEIRGQIGERLSVVIPELAESMNVTTKELDKMFDDGKVTVQNIVDLGVHLEKKYGASAANILKSQMNAGERLKYELSRLALAVGPLFEDIGAGFQNLGSDIVNALIPAIEKVSELLAVTKEGKQLKLDYLIDKNERLDKDAGIKKIFQKTSIPRQEVMDYLKLTNSTEGTMQMLTNKFGEKATKNLTSVDFFKLRQKQERDARVQRIKDQLNPNIKGRKNKKTGGLTDDDKLEKSYQKALQNLKDQKTFQEKLNEGGTAYAERWRKINEIASQFPGEDRKKEIEDLVTEIEKLEEAGKSAYATLKDYLDELEERLRKLKDPMNQLITLTDAAGDSFQDSFKDVIKGTKSVGDAFVDMFNRIADAYLDMVAEMIANQAKQGIVKFLMSVIPGLGGTPDSPSTIPAVPDVITGSSPKNYATGGFVDRPTNALIGEASGEYVIPEHKMSESMSRYQAGVRGKAVIPGSSAADSGGVSGTEIVVSYTGPTLNFNGDDYVPRSAVPEIINSAAKRGARAGEAKVFNNLKNSRSHRSRIGL